jgi:hypothetical protein
MCRRRNSRAASRGGSVLKRAVVKGESDESASRAVLIFFDLKPSEDNVRIKLSSSR